MKALILAGGMGTRLLHNTETTPKTLVPVSGRPILDYQLTALKENGITEIVIVVGKYGEKIKSFVHDTHPDLSVTFIENPTPETSNSSYSFWLAREEIKDTSYIHLNCDMIFYAPTIKKLLSSPYESVIIIDTSVPLDESMEQVILEKEKIVYMDKGMVKGASGKAVGIAKFGPEEISWMISRADTYIQEGDKKQNCYGLIREGCRVKNFYGIGGGADFVQEVNTVKHLEEANARLDS